MSSTQTAVWQGHAKQWDLVGPPLKPSPEDGALMLQLLEPSLLMGKPSARVAVLGVTPEVIQLNWPDGSEIHAFDHSASMIERVWQPHPRLSSTFHHASWQALPVSAGSFDAIAGDGAFNCLPTQAEYGAAFAELALVSKTHASMVVRCFARPDRAESLHEVRDAALSGRVGSFHALKWRIAMAVTESDGTVAVQTIYDAFEGCFHRDELARRAGWSLPVINTIDAYRSAETIYTFPTLAQWQARCQPHWRVDQVLYAKYELADRCPTLRFVRETGAA